MTIPGVVVVDDASATAAGGEMVLSTSSSSSLIKNLEVSLESSLELSNVVLVNSERLARSCS